MLKVVTLKEIEKVFSVIERLGLSREAIVIPLKPTSPGTVQLLADDRLEIVIDSRIPIDDWLPSLEIEIRSILESGAGDRLKREPS